MPGKNVREAAGRRGRGNRAGLTVARIAEAARALPTQGITIKAVADRLGVDRAAIHHYVSDLDGLRELVACDAFSVHLAPVTIPSGAHWREACRLLALSMHDAVLAARGLGAYVRLDGTDIALLEPVEETLRIMIDAGLDDETAARGLAALATLAGGIARERVLAQRPTGHPQVPEIQQALSDSGGSDLPVLKRLTDTGIVGFDRRQLDTSIELLLDGIEARLERITADEP
ncbi:TetR/AcrR family transcriptional regulator C-terminal domain-containing protein [Glycomyces sp. NRRL B-16210]|uniref:TetR/AcrR family transcriptional regulator C-terminal domain-containing protein n=1 Tax=Glycomyces sp. NRRL B-16210 TaxID=1463821 RepID=UPI0009DF0C88|nr:TetR/AcrR family transcriptional regulator C-terminal domain-containing protein [Glycomyces sp. NRRL B-16210]